MYKIRTGLLLLYNCMNFLQLVTEGIQVVVGIPWDPLQLVIEGIQVLLGILWDPLQLVIEGI